MAEPQRSDQIMSGGSKGGSHHYCSVATCKNSGRAACKEGKQIKFFNFPKNEEIRKLWVLKCRNIATWDPAGKRICSIHFKPEDYEDELQARLLGFQPKKLKKEAVPSLSLYPGQDDSVSERSQRQLRRERKKIVQKLLKEYTDNKENTENPVSTTSTEEPNLNVLQQNKESSATSTSPATTTNNMELDTLKETIKILEKENGALRQEIEGLKSNETTMKQKIYELEKNLIKKDSEIKQTEEKLRLALKEIFTTNQLDIIFKKKTKALWTTEEMAKALTLRYLSKRAYIYLRQQCKYPLPGLSTLQRWAANMDLRKGILHDVIRIMGVAGCTKKPIAKVAVLTFDEMKVCSVFEYSVKDDEIVGPHTYMQVIMCRGLFDNWKQPIYIGFDKKMTKELLETVITKLHSIEYNVVACISDCGSGNQGLWRDIGITMDNPITEHPITKKPIYFFADVPHLLKLLRNWFIDTGFTLPSGVNVTKTPVECLVEKTKSEVNSLHKLKDLHLTCEKNERQNVRLAAELFSHTTATALKHYLPGDDIDAAKETGEFIETVNRWFDIFNSYTTNASMPSKKPYGLDLTVQTDVLDKMRNIVREMRCIGKGNALQIFQKAIIMSTTSLQLLFQDLKRQYEIQFILTHRLNQDCLENFFSQLRTRGGLHDHPSPLNVVYRIRMILLGKNPGIVQAHTNVDTSHQHQDDDQYLVATTFERSKLCNIEVPEVPEMPGAQKKVEDRSETTSLSSCLSVSSSTSKEVETDPSERDGLIYLAGYLAKKHQKYYPDLGDHTYKIKQEHTYAIPSWLQHLSFGGLIQPSKEWTQQVQKMDRYFNKIHKETFAYKNKIVHKTTKTIHKQMPLVPFVLCRSFCRQRIFIRIKYLNNKKKQANTGKRKANSEGRKISKKYKKICN